MASLLFISILGFPISCNTWELLPLKLQFRIVVVNKAKHDMTEGN